MKAGLAALALGWAIGPSATPAFSHQDPYVVFVCRITDAAGRPVSGLSVVLDLERRGAQGEAVPPGPGAPGGEAPVLSGAAEAAVGFRWDFTGTVRLRVLDGRRRPVGVLSAEGKVTGGISFTYSHRAGAGTPEPAPGRDFLREGTVWLGGDGNARERADIGAQIPAIRVDWAPEEVSAAEAEQDRRAAVMDRDIEADFRARMDAVRKKRGAR